MDDYNNISHKKLFYEVFNKDYRLYVEFIKMVDLEYDEIIKNLKNVIMVSDIRMNTHRLICILYYLQCTYAEELIYLCKILLNFDKHNINLTRTNYLPFINNIVSFDKSKIGLNIPKPEQIEQLEKIKRKITTSISCQIS